MLPAPEDWSPSAAGQWAPVARWVEAAAWWPSPGWVSVVAEPWPWLAAQSVAVAARWPRPEPVSAPEEPSRWVAGRSVAVVAWWPSVGPVSGPEESWAQPTARLGAVALLAAAPAASPGPAGQAPAGFPLDRTRQAGAGPPAAAAATTPAAAAQANSTRSCFKCSAWTVVRQYRVDGESGSTVRTVTRVQPHATFARPLPSVGQGPH